MVPNTSLNVWADKRGMLSTAAAHNAMRRASAEGREILTDSDSWNSEAAEVRGRDAAGDLPEDSRDALGDALRRF